MKEPTHSPKYNLPQGGRRPEEAPPPPPPPSPPSSHIGARGGKTSRGGRSGASRNSSLEALLAETADYLLRAVLGVAPRPEWGPLWLLPASRGELVAYPRAVAVAPGAPEVGPQSGISEDDA